MAARRRSLARRRKSLGFSQESLAEALGVDPKTVQRWERGVTGDGPQPWLRPKLARLLDVSPDGLEALLVDVERDDDEPDERLAYTLQHPGSVDLTAVARLRERVHELDERYDRAPSTSLLAETGQALGQVTFLSSHAKTQRIRRELSAVEAESAILMGQLVWDASQRRDHATAHRYFDQAVTAARKVHDTAAEGLALLRKSYVALYGETDPDTGLTLTRRAAETTADTSHVLSGLAVLHAAEAHAMRGELAECEQALGDAETRFERIDEDDAALELFSPTQHGRLAGSCYLFLGRAQQAEPILLATAAQLRDRSKSQAIVLGNLSLAYIRQAKLDEAAGTLHGAMDVIEATWGGGGLNILFDACREMQPWRREPSVQDVYDRVMTLMATR
ncbi:helix-turn-helix domain-containing protein [Actinosynnema sp. NPDC051121]